MAFGWLRGIFSTPKVVDTALDVITKGVDGIGKWFFTEQEKAEFALKASNLWLKIQEATANENSIRSITRRVLAVSIMSTFLLFLIMAGVAWPFMAEWSVFLLSLAKSLGNLVLAVAVFYFGPYAIGKYIKK